MADRSLTASVGTHSRDGVLSLADALALAVEGDNSLAVVEKAALAQGIWPEPYIRHRSVLTTDQQLLLLESSVAVIGCGGLGGQVFEQLIRLGVGLIIVIDPDRFAPHNLNRQLLCTMDELGRYKVDAAVRRAMAVNPAVRVIAVRCSFSAGVDPHLGEAGVVIDCLDSVADRISLAEYCRSAAIPLVHGAVRDWWGQVGVQRNAPLLERIYPRPPAGENDAPPSVLACTVATVAALQVAETLKLLLGLDSELVDSWRLIDLKTCEVEQAG